MTDVALFDLDELTEPWEPIYLPEIEDFGWHSDTSISQIPLHADGTKISKAEWDAFLKAGRCRDCGRKGCFDQGGAARGQAWQRCNDCDALHQCEHAHELHGQYAHNWHAGRDHVDLVRAQAKRRAAYRRRNA